MKKTLIVGAMLAGATGLYAQGTVNFSDVLSTFQIHIYAPQTDDPTVQITGNTSSDKPAGTQTAYNGGLVGGSTTGTLTDGANISVELYAAGGGTAAAPLTSLDAVPQYTSTVYTIAAGAGLFKAVSPAGDTGIPGSANGNATVALAAWYNNGGMYTSLAAAQAAGVASGESTPVFITGLGGYTPPGGTPDLPPALGVQSFSLTTTSTSPEPSTIALGIMGASAFLLRRRNSSK
jgi:hypothetical protein